MADLEHALMSLQHQALRHNSDHIGLRDRLVIGNRQGTVAVRCVAPLRRHKGMPRYLPHRLQDTRIRNAAAPQLPSYHDEALGGIVGLLTRTVHRRYDWYPR